MHRSGTSAVASVLSDLGADFGATEGLMASGPDNEPGFWENARLVKVNDDLLALFGGSWDNPPYLPVDWLDDSRLDPLREEAQAVSGSGFSQQLRAWKDPRNSLLLDFWEQLLPIDHIVVALRDPRDVAASLHKRDGFSKEKSAWLWLRYTLSAITTKAPRSLVRFDELVDQPVAVARRLAIELGLESDDQVLEKVRSRVDKDLRHHHVRDVPGQNEPWLQTACFVYSNADSLLSGLVSVLSGGSKLSQVESHLKTVESHLDAVQNQAADFEADRNRILALFHELERGHEAAVADLTKLQKAADESANSAEYLNSALKQLEDQHEALGRRALLAERQLASLKSSLGERRFRRAMARSDR